jgi:HSP20 family molecular chaperone IbpA
MRDVDEWDWVNRIIKDFMGSGFSGGIRRERTYNHYESNDNILEDKDYIYITYELKLSEEDFEIIPREDIVVIYIITTNDRRLFKLPSKVNPQSMETTFNNYVLDIKLEKINEETKNNI